jgi:hypothetical protein
MLQDLNFLHEPATQVPADCKPRTPQDVLNHPSMSVEAKRAALASWASDRHAVPNFPGVRQLENGSLVSLAEILQALRDLDDESDDRVPQRSSSTNLVSLAELRSSNRKKLSKNRLTTRWPHDDDPPSSPAAAPFPVPYSRVNAVGALAVAG